MLPYSMHKIAPEPRVLTVMTTEWSTREEVTAVEWNRANSDDLRRKETEKLGSSWLPLNAILLPDDEREETLLPDYALEIGMTSNGG
jgi:hypothetical protein